MGIFDGMKQAMAEAQTQADAERQKQQALKEKFHADYKDKYVEIDNVNRIVKIMKSEWLTYPLVEASRIHDFKYDEDGEVRVKRNGVGRAIIGGALTCGVGAIVGAMTGTTSEKPIIHSATLTITTDEPKLYKFDLVTKKMKTRSKEYKRLQDQIKLTLIALDKVTTVAPEDSATLNNENADNTEYKQDSDTPSLEKLRQYKQLLDEGIITAEDFEAKKKSILELDVE